MPGIEPRASEWKSKMLPTTPHRKDGSFLFIPLEGSHCFFTKQEKKEIFFLIFFLSWNSGLLIWLSKYFLIIFNSYETLPFIYTHIFYSIPFFFFFSPSSILSNIFANFHSAHFFPRWLINATWQVKETKSSLKNSPILNVSGTGSCGQQKSHVVQDTPKKYLLFSILQSLPPPPPYLLSSSPLLLLPP